MKNFLIAALLIATLALTVSPKAAVEEPAVTEPEVCYGGLKVQDIKADVEEETIEEPAEEVETVKEETPVVSTVPVAEAPVEPSQANDHWAEIYIMAQAVAGESYAHDFDDQLKVCMTICNRVDNWQFPNSIQAVITQPYQIHGYSPNNTPAQTYIDAATMVVNAWYGMKDGAPCDWWNGSYLFWSAAGGRNAFRSEY